MGLSDRGFPAYVYAATTVALWGGACVLALTWWALSSFGAPLGFATYLGIGALALGIPAIGLTAYGVLQRRRRGAEAEADEESVQPGDRVEFPR